MTVNLGKVKQKIITQFDKTVKAATSRAIPIVKKEAMKQITTSTMNREAIAKLVTVGMVVVVIWQTSAGVSPMSPVSAQTVINIETLNLTIAS